MAKYDLKQQAADKVAAAKTKWQNGSASKSRL